MFKTIKTFFSKKEETKERALKELLRENLSLIPVDIFYIDDPRTNVPPEKLVDYYRKFYDICRDKDVMDRIKYLINKQALITIQDSKSTGTMDAIGGVNINGMATVKDDFTSLANSYLKEVPTAENFNKFKII